MSPSKGILFAPIAAYIHKLCFDNSWSEKEFEKLLSLPSSRLWINKDSLLLCSEVMDEMEILTICVLPEKRRQHIAQKLLDDLFKYAQKQKVRQIFLEVAEDNFPAQKLYFQSGFIQTGMRENYYTKGNLRLNALCLTKKI